MVELGTKEREAVGKLMMLVIVQVDWSILFRYEVVAEVSMVIEYREEAVVGGLIILPILKVKVLPASTKELKNPLKENTEPVTTPATPVLMEAEAALIVSELEVGVYPLKVNCNDPPEGI